MCPRRVVRRAQRRAVEENRKVRERERRRRGGRRATSFNRRRRRRPTFADLLSSFQWFPPPCVRVRVYSYTRGRPRMWPVIELFNFSRHPRRACLLSPAVSTNYLATEITSSQISPHNATLLHPFETAIRADHTSRQPPSLPLFEHSSSIHFSLNFFTIYIIKFN